MIEISKILGTAAFLFMLAFAGTSFAGETGGLDPQKYFTEAQIQTGKLYSGTRYAIVATRMAIMACFLLFLAYSGFSNICAGLAREKLGGGPASTIAFLTGIYLLYLFVTFPLTYFSSFTVEHRFYFSTQSRSDWFMDYFKAAGLNYLFFVCICAGALALMSRLGALWWIAGGFALTALMFLFAYLLPVVIDPIFNKFTPLQESKLKAEIRGLAQKADLGVEDVYSVDASRRTTKLNAYFTGVGGTRRIVLFDNLLRDSDQGEVLSVVAHEAGHEMKMHIIKGLLMAGLLSFPALFMAGWFAGIGRQAGLAGMEVIPRLMLALFALSVLSMPFQNMISRHFERQSDRIALELTGDPDAFIRTEVKLSVSNLSDVDPPALAVFFLYTHPPVMKRIATAQGFQKRGLKGSGVQGFE
jgi:STE24 endopeptidase